MNARVVGTESEYALMYRSGSAASVSQLGNEALLEHVKSVTPLLVSSLSRKGYTTAGEFLGNGGRFYIDRGGHPEYATPECASVLDLIAHERAGDRIVQDVVEEARTALRRQDRAGEIHVFKNNVDSYGTTYGSHENYLVAPETMDRIHELIPFLVTRQVFAGAGKLGGPDRTNLGYQISQRSDFVDRVYSDRTSQTRGIINIRKREIPVQGRGRRLHVIFGDSNLCQHAIALKIGVTALVLTLLERGLLKNMPELSSAVQTQKAVSHSLDAPVAFQGRKGSVVALDVQRMYLEKALEFFHDGNSGDFDPAILDLWSTTLDGLEQLKIGRDTGALEEDPAELKRKLDWVLKLWLMTRKRETGCDSRALKVLDFRYHDLDPKTGIFRRCEQLALVDRLVDDSVIKRAMTEPPDGTRAWIRGMVIQTAMGRNVEVCCKNWEHVRVTANPKTIFGASAHPFAKVRKMANRLDIRLEDPLMRCEASILEDVKAFADMWD